MLECLMMRGREILDPNIEEGYLFKGSDYVNMTWKESISGNDALSSVSVPVEDNYLNIGGLVSRGLLMTRSPEFSVNSMHAVVNSTGMQSGGRNGVIFGNYSTSFSLNLEITGADGIKVWWDGFPSFTFANRLPLNKNVMVSVTRDRKIFNLFLNGVFIESYNSGTTIPSNAIPGPLSFYIGRDRRTSYPFHGKIGMILLESKLRTGAEVRNLYNSVKMEFSLS